MSDEDLYRKGRFADSFQSKRPPPAQAATANLNRIAAPIAAEWTRILLSTHASHFLILGLRRSGLVAPVEPS